MSNHPADSHDYGEPSSGDPARYGGEDVPTSGDPFGLDAAEALDAKPFGSDECEAGWEG